MKLIGHKEDGDCLLECSEIEYRALRRIVDVAQGRGVMFDTGWREPFDADTKALLGAIGEWIATKDASNQLRRIADQLDEAIKVKP